MSKQYSQEKKFDFRRNRLSARVAASDWYARNFPGRTQFFLKESSLTVPKMSQ